MNKFSHAKEWFFVVVVFGIIRGDSCQVTTQSVTLPILLLPVDEYNFITLSKSSSFDPKSSS